MFHAHHKLYVHFEPYKINHTNRDHRGKLYYSKFLDYCKLSVHFENNHYRPNLNYNDSIFHPSTPVIANEVKQSILTLLQCHSRAGGNPGGKIFLMSC